MVPKDRRLVADSLDIFWDRVTKFKGIIAENEQLHGQKLLKTKFKYVCL